MGLWNSLSGYVIIQIKGLGLERFINAAAAQGIVLQNLKRQKDGSLQARVNVEDFYALHRMRRELRGEIHILQKRGLIMRLSRLRHRKVLLYGWVLILLVLFIASRYLWFVDIQGCSNISETEILEILAGQGVAPGVNRSTIRLNSLAEAIRVADSRVSWAGASMQGVILRVRIEESQEIPAYDEDETPANIVAAKDGLIRSIVAINGREQVEAGKVVRAGELLISGALTRDGYETMYVRAKGTVIAEVTYVFTATVGPKLVTYVKTGETQDYTEISLFGWSFTGFEADYKAYTVELRKRVLLTGCFLPLFVSEYRCFALEKVLEAASEAELIEAALAEAEAKMLAALPKDARILSKSSSTELLADGTVRASIVVTTEEDIGYRVPIQ